MRVQSAWVFILTLTSTLSLAGPTLSLPHHKSNENWASIDDGILYRSQKLTTEQLRNRIQQHQVASILCLAECSQEEQEVARDLGLKYYDRNMNIPEIELSDVYDIVDILKHSPKPLLVHCRKGADRTGMAATLYFHTIKGESLKLSIKKGMRLRYGHLGKIWTPRIYEILHEFENENSK